MNNLNSSAHSPVFADGADDCLDPARYFEQWYQELADSSKAAEAILDDVDTTDCFLPDTSEVISNLEFNGVMHLDGHTVGPIRSAQGTLIVTRKAIIDADIEVAVALIHGCVNGDVTASGRVFLGNDAVVTGKIRTPKLLATQGAVLEGDCIFTLSSDVGALEEMSFPETEEVEELLVSV